jgi:hypothetical protein
MGTHALVRLAYSTVSALSKRGSSSSGQPIGFSVESADEVVVWWVFVIFRDPP